MILFALSTASGFSYLETCDGTPVHWADGRTRWTLSTEGLPQGQSAIITTNTSAWSVWSDPASCCAALDVRYAGLSSEPWSTLDDLNTVEFASTAWDPALGSGVTTVAVTVPVYGATSCRVESVDQVYNAVNFSFGESPDLDLLDLMTHENGHWLGLDHSEEPGASMAIGGLTAGFDTLSIDDETAVCTLHPGDCAGVEVCDNGIDDDADGWLDCADLACISFDGCACPTATALSAVDSVRGDTRSSTSRTDSYSCADGLSGPEIVYTVTAPADGRLHVQLTDLTTNLDLLVGIVGDDACLLDTCSTQRNEGTNAEKASIEVTEGTTYTLVVDGADPEGGAFELSTAFEPLAVEACPVERSLTCGDRVEGTNLDGGTDILSFGCVDWDTPGRESVYAFAPDTTGEVTVTLGTLSADLDLFVTTAPEGGCGDAGCVASSGEVGLLDERVVFEARAGVDYRIIADGFDTSSTPFSLTIDCETTPVAPPSGGCSTAPSGVSALLLPLLLVLRRRSTSA